MPETVVALKPKRKYSPSIKANSVEIVAIADLLRAVCHKNENGFAIYREGFNDQVIAEQIGGRIKVQQVKNIRKALIGHLPKNGPPQRPIDIDKRVDQLEKQVEQMDFFLLALCLKLKLNPETVLAEYTR